MTKNFLLLLLYALFASSIAIAQKNWTKADENKYIVNFTNGTLPIRKNGKWGLVDSNNQIRINIEYDSILAAGIGICVLQKDNNHYFMNEKFQILYETSNAKLEFLNYYWKVSTNEKEEYLINVDGELKIFSKLDDYSKYMTDYNFIKTVKNCTTDKNAIDSILKIPEGDSIYIIIKYKDGKKIVTEKSNQFQFNAPYFITYMTAGKPDKQRIVNLENRKTNYIEDGILSSSFTLDNHNYLIISKGSHCEVMDQKSGKIITKTKNMAYQFGELLISHTNEKNSYEIYQIKKNKNLFSGLVSVDQFDDYLICVDTLGFISFVTNNGQVFFKEKKDEISDYYILIGDKTIQNLMDCKIVRLSKKQGNSILVSTKGEILYEGQQEILSKGANTFIIKYPNNTTKVGFYDYDSKSIKYFETYDDIKSITPEVYAVKLPFTRISDEKWVIVDRSGQPIINKIFNSIEIIRYYNSDDFILRSIVEDTVLYYNKQLVQIEPVFDKKLKIKRIQSIHSEISDGELNYLELFDKANKQITGLIDFNLNIILTETFNDIYYNRKGKYFFVLTTEGEFGYMRTNGKMLY